MRKPAKRGSLTVQAIAGTYVVLLGIDIKAEARKGLLGFAIERQDHTEKARGFLENFLLFKANDRGAQPDHSSGKNPFQGFLWGDYTAKPSHDYTYRVTAMYGRPERLTPRDALSVRIQTEDPELDRHAIFFNRGAATSQAYARKFGDRDPDQVPNREAYVWLSRGLEEAVLAFIAKAAGKGWGLRAAVYEFDYLPVLDALGSAAKRGADVKVIFADVDNSTKKQPVPEPADGNEKAIATAQIEKLCVARRKTSEIPHNKFIVLLRNGKPQQVWTGSTNLTKGGIFGHSNVGHAVRNETVAASYLEYWTQLSGDPEAAKLEPWTLKESDLPEQKLGTDNIWPRANSISHVFSPRPKIDALDWYAELMDHAHSSVFLTAAFGVSQQLREVFDQKKPYLRYLLLDNRNGKVDIVARDIESDPNNQVTAGGYIGKDGWHQWVAEHLTGFNHWVQFIHTKYMLIDPLSDDPTVITGSANFSEASTIGNDENMLIIRGDTHVADIYLGEFMRLFTAFRLRAKTNAKPEQHAPGPDLPRAKTSTAYLQTTDRWADRFYVEGSPEAKERLLFSGQALEQSPA
jgi:phosphatidylserine/phosphatidylglycerophosphate/cardiolipin synthase-like enzyme